MNKQNEIAVETLLNQFKTNLHEVQDQYNNSKRQADGLKMIFEERLTQTEDDNSAEIKELKSCCEKELKQLQEVCDVIKKDIETIHRQERREEEELKMYKDIKEKAILEETKKKAEIQKKEEDIKKLE